MVRSAKLGACIGEKKRKKHQKKKRKKQKTVTILSIPLYASKRKKEKKKNPSLPVAKGGLGSLQKKRGGGGFFFLLPLEERGRRESASIRHHREVGETLKTLKFQGKRKKGKEKDPRPSSAARLAQLLSDRLGRRKKERAAFRRALRAIGRREVRREGKGKGRVERPSHSEGKKGKGEAPIASNCGLRTKGREFLVSPALRGVNSPKGWGGEGCYFAKKFHRRGASTLIPAIGEGKEEFTLFIHSGWRTRSLLEKGGLSPSLLRKRVPFTLPRGEGGKRKRLTLPSSRA